MLRLGARTDARGLRALVEIYVPRGVPLPPVSIAAWRSRKTLDGSACGLPFIYGSDANATGAAVRYDCTTEPPYAGYAFGVGEIMSCGRTHSANSASVKNPRPAGPPASTSVVPSLWAFLAIIVALS